MMLRKAAPVMLALLIQSVYNIVDSLFVARFSPDGLTALSILFPIQLLMTAFATGTGVGLGILISRADGEGHTDGQGGLLKSGLFLGLVNYILFALAGFFLMEPFMRLCSDSPAVQEAGMQYAHTVMLGSFGLFTEGICTKILQAKGRMTLPMAAQVTGALINICLDPILIFGFFGMPEMGIRGAAAATIIGQWAAMVVLLPAVSGMMPHGGQISAKSCLRIYKAGIPSIVMQSLYCLYITGLNLILKQFTEDAVTVLGIYYKLQTFFFIPMLGLQQVLVPSFSYYYGAGRLEEGKKLLRSAVVFSVSCMCAGLLVFCILPDQMLGLFSGSVSVHEIGRTAFRIIGISFPAAGVTMMLTSWFQGVGRGAACTGVTVLRQVILLVPLAWLLHFLGLSAVWATFPITEAITLAVCIVLMKQEKQEETEDHLTKL